MFDKIDTFRVMLSFLDLPTCLIVGCVNQTTHVFVASIVVHDRAVLIMDKLMNERHPNAITTLNQTPGLVFKIVTENVSGEDFSGRFFENISIFQYAYWSKNIDFCTSLCFIGRLNLPFFSNLIQNAKTSTVIYCDRDGEMHRETIDEYCHLLINSMRILITREDLSEEDHTLCLKYIAKYQASLPLNWLQEFCERRRMNTVMFDEPLQDTPICYYDRRIEDPRLRTQHLEKHSNYGRTFFLKRAYGYDLNGIVSTELSENYDHFRGALSLDLIFFNTLSKTRKDQFEKLERILDETLTIL